MPLLVAIVLQFSQQLSGINAVCILVTLDVTIIFNDYIIVTLIVVVNMKAFPLMSCTLYCHCCRGNVSIVVDVITVISIVVVIMYL